MLKNIFWLELYLFLKKFILFSRPRASKDLLVY